MIFRAVAGHALLVDLAETPSEAAHAAVLGLDAALAATPAPGQVETVPAFVNLLVVFDPQETSHAEVEAHVRALHAPPKTASGVVHEVPVTYDGRDLQEVARRSGIPADQVARRHAEGDYKVVMYGFAPGYAYLSGLPPALRLDRKPAPVRDVPAGSVIIAGGQCLVTTLTMPTGWWILGRTETRVLTGDPARPFLFAVGDRIRFVPCA